MLSLEDFHRTFAARIAEIDVVLTKLTTTLQSRPPALGTFTDAMRNAQEYTRLRLRHTERAGRLKEAIVAARVATDTIISDYRTAEARNRATAGEIAAALDGVDEALGGDGADV